MWGTYWEWDPRLTSELILLFLYLGYMGLRSAMDDVQRADRASALLAVVGLGGVIYALTEGASGRSAVPDTRPSSFAAVADQPCTVNTVPTGGNGGPEASQAKVAASSS